VETLFSGSDFYGMDQVFLDGRAMPFLAGVVVSACFVCVFPDRLVSCDERGLRMTLARPGNETFSLIFSRQGIPHRVVQMVLQYSSVGQVL
jgi:hypothetical protein